jgi:hypothetical protein
MGFARYFNTAYTKFSAGKLPHTRWAISHRELTIQCLGETLTSWLHHVLRAVHEQQPKGFSWTSHSLRKGFATVAYGIGVPTQKIKLFGGWARESDAILDYIDPTILQSP